MNTVWTTERTGKVIERSILATTYSDRKLACPRPDIGEDFCFISKANEHPSKDAAIIVARLKVAKKIASLRKQIAKLETMKIEEVPLP